MCACLTYPKKRGRTKGRKVPKKVRTPKGAKKYKGRKR